MAEQELQKQMKEEKPTGKTFNSSSKIEDDRVIRILAKDIEGKMKIYAGLTKIKGVSWGLSNAVCKVLEIDKNKKIGSLTDDEIKKISDFIKNPKIPEYLVNRRSDFTTGENKHLSGGDLELQKEFDIKRLKKIKSYRGFRHMSGLPTRGQKTRSNFRPNKKKAGIKKKGKKK